MNFTREQAEQYITDERFLIRNSSGRYDNQPFAVTAKIKGAVKHFRITAEYDYNQNVNYQINALDQKGRKFQNIEEIILSIGQNHNQNLTPFTVFILSSIIF